MLSKLVTIAACLCLFAVSVASGAAERIVVSDLAGARVAPLDAGKRKATVLVFITNDCPIANACAPEIERIYRKYSAQNIGMYLVYVDASLKLEAARVHHKDYQYSCPAVIDPEHRLVKVGRAQMTPEAAVFDGKGKLVYHGRIDDRAVALGQVRAQPLTHDLRDALDAILRGKPIAEPYRKAVGCSIADLGK